MKARSVWLCLAVLLALPLSGCIGIENGPGGQESEDGPNLLPALEDPFTRPQRPDRSFEAVRIVIRGESPFEIGIPVPVSSPGTTFDDWAQNLTIDGPADAEGRTIDKRRVLWVEGSAGTTIVESTVIQEPLVGNKCCAEAFLDAKWTTQADHAPNGELLALMGAGTFTVSVEYKAAANYCWADGSFSLESKQHREWQEARMPRGATCT